MASNFLPFQTLKDIFNTSKLKEEFENFKKGDSTQSNDRHAQLALIVEFFSKMSGNDFKDETIDKIIREFKLKEQQKDKNDEANEIEKKAKEIEEKEKGKIISGVMMQIAKKNSGLSKELMEMVDKDNKLEKKDKNEAEMAYRRVRIAHHIQQKEPKNPINEELKKEFEAIVTRRKEQKMLISNAFKMEVTENFSELDKAHTIIALMDKTYTDIDKKEWRGGGLHDGLKEILSKIDKIDPKIRNEAPHSFRNFLLKRTEKGENPVELINFMKKLTKDIPANVYTTLKIATDLGLNQDNKKALADHVRVEDPHNAITTKITFPHLKHPKKEKTVEKPEDTKIKFPYLKHLKKEKPVVKLEDKDKKEENAYIACDIVLMSSLPDEKTLSNFKRATYVRVRNDKENDLYYVDKDKQITKIELDEQKLLKEKLKEFDEKMKPISILEGRELIFMSSLPDKETISKFKHPIYLRVRNDKEDKLYYVDKEKKCIEIRFDEKQVEKKLNEFDEKMKPGNNVRPLLPLLNDELLQTGLKNQLLISSMKGSIFPKEKLIDEKNKFKNELNEITLTTGHSHEEVAQKKLHHRLFREPLEKISKEKIELKKVNTWLDNKSPRR